MDSYEQTRQEIDEKFDSCVSADEPVIKKFKDLVRRYRKVFYKKPSQIKSFAYYFKVKYSQPFFVKPYPILIDYRDAVRDDIKKMLDWGVIRRSNSQYINRIIPVRKKDNSIRLCLDASKLNDKLVNHHESTQY